MKQESVANTTHISVFTIWMWKVLLIQHDRCYQQINILQCQLQHIYIILTIWFGEFHIILKLPSNFQAPINIFWRAMAVIYRLTDRHVSLLYKLLWQTTMLQTQRLYRQNLKGSENSTLYYTWLMFWTLYTDFIY